MLAQMWMHTQTCCMMTQTAGQRLRDAISRWGSQRQFAQSIVPVARAAGVSASYGTLRRYLADNPTPPLDFLQLAAQELDVSFAWLATGTGRPERKVSQTEVDAVLVRPVSVADQLVRVAAMQRAIAAEVAHIAKQLDEE
jgi:transcriptional regulator with XRE-family HTH domain